MAQATARHILVSSEAKCNELKAAIEVGAAFDRGLQFIAFGFTGNQDMTSSGLGLSLIHI